MFYRLVLLLTLTACTLGCAGSGAVTDGEAVSLVDVNLRLHEQEARVELTDGSTIHAANVFVAPDSTRFRTEAGLAAVATSRVERVVYEEDHGSIQGWSLGGAVAGFTLAALSGAALGTPIVVGGGAVFGLFIGLLEQVDRGPVVAYEAPFDRYSRGP